MKNFAPYLRLLSIAIALSIALPAFTGERQMPKWRAEFQKIVPSLDCLLGRESCGPKEIKKARAVVGSFVAAFGVAILGAGIITYMAKRSKRNTLTGKIETERKQAEQQAFEAERTRLAEEEQRLEKERRRLRQQAQQEKERLEEEQKKQKRAATLEAERIRIQKMQEQDELERQQREEQLRLAREQRALELQKKREEETRRIKLTNPKKWINDTLNPVRGQPAELAQKKQGLLNDSDLAQYKSDIEIWPSIKPLTTESSDINPLESSEE